MTKKRNTYLTFWNKWTIVLILIVVGGGVLIYWKGHDLGLFPMFPQRTAGPLAVGYSFTYREVDRDSYVRYTILSINGPVLGLSVNISQYSELSVDVREPSNLFIPAFIGRDLSVGDLVIYRWESSTGHEWKGVVNHIGNISFQGQDRETIEASAFDVLRGIDLVYYWDRQLGLLLEARNGRSGELAIIMLTSDPVFPRIVPEFPAILPLLVFLFTSTFVLIQKRRTRHVVWWVNFTPKPKRTSLRDRPSS